MGYSYNLLEHPADIKLKIVADSLGELFEGALKGMAEILVLKEDFTSEEVRKKIKVSSIDISSLLVDFLSEVLALSDINDCVFIELLIINLKDNEIEAEIKGFKVNKFKEEIKAVTYHKTEVKKNSQNQFEAEILFDI